MKNAKADASLYLLTCLLQRLETSNPGLLKEMIEGVKSDQSSLPDDVPGKEHIEQIFKESLLILERSNLLLASNENS